MAAIQERKSKDGKVSYRVQVRLRGYPPQTATFERKTDAKRWVNETEAAIREGRYFKTNESRKRTLAEMCDRYVKDVLPGKSASLQRGQKQQLAWWKSRIGDYTLGDVTPALNDRMMLLGDAIKEYKMRTAQQVKVPSKVASAQS